MFKVIYLQLVFYTMLSVALPLVSKNARFFSNLAYFQFWPNLALFYEFLISKTNKNDLKNKNL